MKKTISVILSLIMLFCSFPFIVNAEEPDQNSKLEINEENFPDEEFRKFVSETFDHDNDGFIGEWDNYYRQNTINNNRLDIKNKNIKSLQGLDLLANFFSSSDIPIHKQSGCEFCITDLYIENLQITELPKIDTLEYLYISNTPLEKIDVSSAENLLELEIDNSNITSIDISKNTKLKSLTILNSKITEISTQNNTELCSLAIENSNISEIDLSKNEKLQYLRLGYLNITDLDLFNNIELISLHCYNNHLRYLNLDNNKNLTSFWCPNQTIEEDYAYSKELGSVVLDMNNVVDDISNVFIKDTDDYTYNKETGIVTLQNPYATISYFYCDLNLRYFDNNHWPLEVTVTGLLADADYTEVDDAIASIPEDLSIYTEESVNALNYIISNPVERNLDITEQKAVYDYAQSIVNAIDALDYKPADYTEVEKAIASIPKDLSIYTEESVNVLYNTVNEVTYDKNITEQYIVDNYALNIASAVDGLVIKENLEEPAFEEPNRDPVTDKDKPSATKPSTTEEYIKNTSDKSPNTGAPSIIMPIVILFVVLIFSIFVFYFKRYLRKEGNINE